eukprot:4287276-Prymnesium_polylepis.2
MRKIAILGETSLTAGRPLVPRLAPPPLTACLPPPAPHVAGLGRTPIGQLEQEAYMKQGALAILKATERDFSPEQRVLGVRLTRKGSHPSSACWGPTCAYPCPSP